MDFFDTSFPLKPHANRGKTFNWMGSDTPQNYQNKNYTDYDIKYTYNSHGFRCDEFVDSKFRMLFLGCSVTEGIGLPITETFSYLIYTEIKNKIGKDFPYWNLGIGAGGLDSIIRAYYHYHDILKPQVVISLFPTYRLEFYNKSCWISIMPNWDPEEIFKNNHFLIQPSVIKYNTQKNLAILDLLFQKNNTMQIWDTWDEKIFSNLNLTSLKTFDNFLNQWKSIDQRLPKARDNMHPGKEFNQMFSKKLLDEYSDKICEKLTV